MPRSIPVSDADARADSRVLVMPMGAERYAAWLPPNLAAYAESKVRAGNWPAADAEGRALKETAALLPQGQATPGHFFYSLLCPATREEVGTLWVKESPDADPPNAYIYSIEVAPEWRSHGFATAALQALETGLKSRGIHRLLLHVFGYNRDAQRLYARLGFTATNISMAKEL